VPLSIEELRSASARRSAEALTLTEARSLGLKTVFLCHSHHDADLIQGVLNHFSDEGWRVYVDWADEAMPESPNRETAQRIQQKIVQLQYFVFLATPNSMASRWCPWEIGYADGKKSVDQILILPTTDRSRRWHGSEYLQLYKKIDWAEGGGLGVWDPGETTGRRLYSFR